MIRPKYWRESPGIKIATGKVSNSGFENVWRGRGSSQNKDYTPCSTREDCERLAGMSLETCLQDGSKAEEKKDKLSWIKIQHGALNEKCKFSHDQRFRDGPDVRMCLLHR